MSKENNHLIINCGSTHISASVFSYAEDRLKIEKFHSLSLDYDYQNDDAWLDAVDVGIREIVRIGKLSGKANIIIPGNQVLAKTLMLPTVAEKKRAQVLAFEAQHNLPYDLDEVVWDGHIISNDGIESEVLLGACKSEMINQFSRIIRDSGLLIESINTSTILSFPALSICQPNLGDDVLLINVGARSSNLFFKNKESIFIRSINYGGNTLSQFISDTVGKGFTESDEIKHRFFQEEGSIDQESSAYKLIQTCIANFSSRFVEELNRSILMYQRQKGVSDVKQIFITGKGAESEIIRNKISEELGREIQIFNPLDAVDLPSNLDPSNRELNIELTEAIGQALIRFNQVENIGSLNLLPLKAKQELKFIGQKPLLALAAILIAASSWFLYFGISKAFDANQDSYIKLKQIAEPFLTKESVISENSFKAQTLSKSISQVEGLVESKTNWIQFFADIQESIFKAKDVWIDDLTVTRISLNEDPFEGDYDYFDDLSEENEETSNYEVVVKGKMLVRQSAAEISQDVLADRIKQIKSSFEESSFVTKSSQPKISWKYLSDGLRVLPFEISLTINSEKPL